MKSFAPIMQLPARALVCALAVALTTAGCEKDEKAAPPPIRPVKYQVVQKSGGLKTVVFSGQSSAGVESRLSFKVRGNLNEIAVKVGDKVTKGQLIAELDKTDYQLQVDQARANLASASAQSSNAKSSYERTEKMYETETATASQLEAARAAYQQARAQVGAASKAVKLAQQQVSYTRLVAPVDGSIAQVPVEPNENVNPGQPIVLLTSGDKPKVTVAVADKYIGDVQAGNAVKVRFPDVGANPFDAVVSEVSPTSSGTGASVTVLLGNPTDQVRPGMSADVEFQFGSADDKERYIVPPAAVGQDRNGEFVFVVERQQESGLGTVKRAAVKINQEPTADGVEITEGIEEGDLVVTAGRTRISEGLTVKIPVKAAP